MKTREKKIIEQYQKLEQKYQDARRANDTTEEAVKIFNKLSKLAEKVKEIKVKYALS
jgi:hypothetical protein